MVDATGKLLDTGTIYPHEPKNDWKGSINTLQDMINRHHVTLITIGNGTASRETEKLVSELTRNAPQTKYLIVNEAGASVYSASALARQEFPDLDVTIRGAVSIARRAQDPLAELVKIDPKSIGVGLYQHDVDQTSLTHALDGVVESVVNQVGVDVNTASPALLTHVAGIGSKLARTLSPIGMPTVLSSRGLPSARSRLRRQSLRTGSRIHAHSGGHKSIGCLCDPS